MMPNLLPLISTIDELIAVVISDQQGKIIHTYQKSPSLVDFEKVLIIINNALSLITQPIYRKKNEFIIFFGKGTLYLKIFPTQQVLLILNTGNPSAFSCFAIKDFLKKIESESLGNNYVQELVNNTSFLPLSIFQPVIDILAKYYGPAAKLMVKKALKLSNATSSGISASMLDHFEKMIENEIIDMHLRTKILHEIKEALKKYH